MGEQKQILQLSVIVLFIGLVGVVGLYFYRSTSQNIDVVESYVATLYPDGKFDETFNYKLSSRDTAMLYRNWDDTLSLKPLSGTGYIIPLSINPPPGTVAYVKDINGVVTVMSGSADAYARSEIARLAYDNEAGCYGAQDFQPGAYTISYSFKLFLPIESDSSYDHLNFQLARVHIPYKNVRIVLPDAEYVTEIYPHPPSMTVLREGNQIVIIGSAAENELVEVEMLMKPGAHQIQTGYASQVPNVEGLTRNANFWYSLYYNGSVWLGYAGTLLAMTSPLILYWLFSLYGKETDVTVPEYLSFVPNPERRPWLVNAVFRKNVGDFDENGFYSTLLDLHTRKKIRIEPREGGMKIQLVDPTVDDDYDKRVIGFLQSLAKENVFDTDTLKELAGSINSGSGSSLAIKAQRDLIDISGKPPSNLNWATYIPMVAVLFIFGSFFITMGITSDTIFPLGFLVIISIIILYQVLSQNKQSNIKLLTNYDAFVTKGRIHIWPVAAIGLIILICALAIAILEPNVGSQILVPIVLGTVIIVQSAIVLVFPQSLFGRWKPGLYKEKLSWDAFRAHLSDLAQMKKYSTEDLNMWGSWLVYGTALGVGDKVAAAMKELKVNIDIAPVTPAMRSHFYPIRVAAAPVSRSSEGSRGGSRGGGGRMGGGGGRGGGGGGRRGR
jgi:uncharacterized membrane protein